MGLQESWLGNGMSSQELVVIGQSELDDLVSWHERQAHKHGYAQGFEAGELNAQQARVERAFGLGMLVAAVFWICWECIA